jgi:hypothetical protein
MLTRAILVQDLAQARAAATAASDLGVALTLASAPGAAAYLGPGWARALAKTLAHDYPQVALTLILDCGDRPGLVLAALRLGLRDLRFTGRKQAADKLAEIAMAQGARLNTGKLRTLDLAREADPAAACRAWLAGP